MIYLDDMAEDLAPLLATEGVVGHSEVGEADLAHGPPNLAGTAPVVVYDDGQLVATGVATTIMDRSAGTVDLIMEITEDTLTRTLEQTVSQADGVISLCGTLTRSDGGDALHGGWTYSQQGGPIENLDSDPGFHDEVRAMLHIVPGETREGAGTRSFGIGSIMSLIANIVTMVVNYTFDVLTPYTPPVSCDGPLIYNGSGQSCEGGNVSCADDLDNICAEIDGIPDVSNAFKKCMKGRCGCGGSSFRRARITCADPDDCGPCTIWGGPWGGCNMGGSLIWYCHTHPDPCECVETVFHEMSHGCGALDQTDESYRIGRWFEDQCTLTQAP